MAMSTVKQPEFAAYAARLKRALDRAGLSAGQFARLLEDHDSGDFRYPPGTADVRLPYSFVNRCLTGRTMPYDGARLIFAELLECDPRWLATGWMSVAATRAIESLPSEAALKPGVTSNLELLAQPAGDEEICRYCGRNGETIGEYNACLKAQNDPHAIYIEWVDYMHTLCSACLEPRREEILPFPAPSESSPPRVA